MRSQKAQLFNELQQHKAASKLRTYISSLPFGMATRLHCAVLLPLLHCTLAHAWPNHCPPHTASL
jgi:hypothetical protein